MTVSDLDFEDAFGFDVIITGDTARCMELTVEASCIETEAMDLDRLGPPNLDAAAAAYRRTEQVLLEAIAQCPEYHPDRGVLEEHAREVGTRAAYLEDLRGEAAAVPLEDHIHAVTLTMGLPPPSPSRNGNSVLARRSTQPVGHKQVMSAAAAIGGATGLLLMGPMSAVALGVGAAYASTRKDTAGSAVRKVGKVGVRAVHHARDLNEEYRLSTHAMAAGNSALGQVASLARRAAPESTVSAVDSRCGLADKARHTSRALVTFNEKHRVTHTLGWGISTAGAALNGLVSKATTR